MSEEEHSHHPWCEKQEKLLRSWAERAAGYRWLHNHARLHYKKQNDYLSYPSIVIASITGLVASQFLIQVEMKTWSLQRGLKL
jgi:hypothetical protein